MTSARANARLVQPELFEYSEAELRAAHAQLYAEHRLSMPYAVAIADTCWIHVVRCRALDMRRRAAAHQPSGYRPAHSTDIRQTIARARLDLQRLAQPTLALDDEEAGQCS